LKKIFYSILILGLFLLFVSPRTEAYGSSYAVIDAKTGRLLFGSNSHQQAPIASLTKIWTAYVTTEEVDILDEAVITSNAATQEGSSIYLKVGDHQPIEKLLYGLMLRSGNDAAVALAEHVGGSVEGFVDLMNEKARVAGLQHTVFKNPSGLHHEEHLSTAYDTALMLKSAMSNKQLKKIMSTDYYRYDGVHWENKHKLVRSNSLAISGKTGYTKASGRTLATFFKKGEQEIIVVTLNDSNDWKTHQQLADKAFNQYNMVQLVEEGAYDLPGDLVVRLSKPIHMIVNEKEQVQHVVILNRSQDGVRTGQWTVQIDGKPVYSQQVHIERNRR
jgi:D-alanyl-D-alanine carboxypeptidase